MSHICICKLSVEELLKPDMVLMHGDRLTISMLHSNRSARCFFVIAQVEGGELSVTVDDHAMT
jgi:UDP-N-acetylglucosamine 2-epimerase